MKYGNLEYVHKSILDENDNILVSEELKIFSLQKIRPGGCVCVEGKRLVEKILCNWKDTTWEGDCIVTIGQ